MSDLERLKTTGGFQQLLNEIEGWGIALTCPEQPSFNSSTLGFTTSAPGAA